MNKPYDIVVFGATGFTGQYAVEEVAKAVNKDKEKGGHHISWAIAGRSQSKLKECLRIAQDETSIDLHDVGILIVNVSDDMSIDNMTKNAKVIINCVGPYHLYGRPIVESCIKNGASQVDISGEPQYVEKMMLLFDGEAEKAGVHIVSSCGYDSVPADVGLCHLSKTFPGRLNSARGYMTMTGTRTSIHTGTMESASLALTQFSDIKSLRAQRYPTKLPDPKYPQGSTYGFHKSKDLSLWGLRFPSDEGMTYRSQRYLAEKTDLPFVQYQGFLANRYLPLMIGVLMGIMYFIFISFFTFTRNLLFKHPKLMTAGMFTTEGPAREKLKKAGFKTIIVGEGWKKKLADKNEQYTYPPDHKVILHISGPDPGYRGTSIMLVACAMCLLREKDSCTGRGGVTSAGMTFVNTSIFHRLIEGGIRIDMKEV